LQLSQGKHILTITKESKGLGMPWEKEYGYAQAVKVGDTIYVSGQLSHGDGANSSVLERGISIYRIQNGKMVETWHVVDGLPANE
jgi:hypothetical protein